MSKGYLGTSGLGALSSMGSLSEESLDELSAKGLEAVIKRQNALLLPIFARAFIGALGFLRVLG